MIETVKSSHFDVYIDETGQTPYYNDEQQPLMLLIGVVTKKSNAEFDEKLQQLLENFELDIDTEFHAAPIISGEAPFNHLSVHQRQELLFEFIKVGAGHIDYYHRASKLKPFAMPKEREDLRKRNLDPYLRMLHYFVTSLDFFMGRLLDANYRLFFDSCSDFNKRTKRMVKELSYHSDTNYYLKRLIGEPTQIKSEASRFIQLADAICYIQARYDQITTETYKLKKKLLKHQNFFKKCHDLFSQKMVFIERDMPKDFKYLMDSGFFIEYNKMTTDWKKKDFSYVGKWLARKRKPDYFRYDVNSFWESKNEEILEFTQTLDKKVKNIRLTKTNIIGYEKFMAEVAILCFIQYKEVLLEEFKEFCDLPNAKYLPDPIEKKIIELEFSHGINRHCTSKISMEIAFGLFHEIKLIPDDIKIGQKLLAKNHKEMKIFLNIYVYMQKILKETEKCFTEIDKNLNKAHGLSGGIVLIKDSEKIDRIIILLKEHIDKLNLHLNTYKEEFVQDISCILNAKKSEDYLFYEKLFLKKQGTELVDFINKVDIGMKAIKKFLCDSYYLNLDLEVYVQFENILTCLISSINKITDF